MRASSWISQILVFGLTTALSGLAPQLENSATDGYSLEDIILKVGAQSTMQPENLENNSGSIQASKVRDLFMAVEMSPFSTQVVNSASHSWEKNNSLLHNS